MLTYLRHPGFKKNVFIFLVAVLVLSFVISFAVISQDDTKSYAALAKFEGKNITTQEYLASYRAVQNQLRWTYGDELDEVRNRVNIKGEAWDRILLLSYAKKNRIHVSDKEVVDWITSQETFQRQGKFDPDYYKMFVERALRADARTFEEEARQMLTLRKIYQVEAEKVAISDEELRSLYTAERSGKDIVYGILPWQNFMAQVPAVEDKDIEQLYSLVKDTLTRPEQVKLSYVTLSSAELETKKAALDDKAPLEDLARTHALQKKETPYFSKKDSVPELSHFEVLSAAFTTAKGAESGWIHHEGGSTKLRVDDKKPEAKMTMEEAKEELKTLYARQKANELAIKKMKEIRDKSGADIEGPLQAEGVAVQSLRYAKGTAHPVMPAEALDRAVAKLNVGEVSEPVETLKGALLAKVTGVSAVDEAAFEKDKADFAAQKKEEKAGEKMTELMESLRKKLALNLELMKEIFPAE